MPRGIPHTPEEREVARKLKNERRVARRKHRIATDPAYHEQIKAGWRSWYANGNQQIVKDAVIRYRRASPQRAMFNGIWSSAKKRDLKVDIAFEDISFPTHCPALGIELDYGRKGGRGPRDNSPSFDRIHNDIGYVKGNVIVVSQLANRIKTSATPEQIRRVADFYGALGAV